MKEITKIIFTDALGREHTESFESSSKDDTNDYWMKIRVHAARIADKRLEIKEGKD